jgi:putative ABC transport system permease protein
MLKNLWQDLRFGIRILWKHPGFGVVSVLTLALGIGANTAIFSVLQAAFFAQYPIKNPDELLRVYGEERGRNLSQLNLSVPKFEFIRDQQTVFSGLGGANFVAFTLIESGEPPLQVNGAYSTANFLQTFGATPVQGRFFEPAEEEGAPAVVLSETLWRERYAADPSVIGRGLNLSGLTYTIVGVAPRLPAFWQAEIWVTRPFQPPNLTPELIQRGVSFLWTAGRLKPGVTPAAAQQELALIAQRYRQEHADKVDSSWNLVTVPMRDDIVGSARSPILILLAAVGLVLLIACANVANLVLVRFAGRLREVALRSALGASRGRVVQQFLIEGLLISALACVLGLVLARVSLPALIRLAQNFVTFSGDIEINLLVLAASAGVAVITGLLIGVYPALLASHMEPATALREGGRSMAGSRSQNRVRNVLVAGQVAVTLLLIAGAVLLTTSFLRLQNQPPGFRPDGVFTAELTLPQARYPDIDAQARFYRRVIEEMRNTPGVVAVGLIQGLPLSNRINRSPYARADGDVPPVKERPLGLTRSITPGYFGTLEIPLLAGRDFNDHDVNDAPQAVIISRGTARRLFPDGNAIGRRILMGTNNGVGLSMEVIGVVDDVRSQTLAQVADVEFYRPVMQRQSGFMQLAIRTQTEPMALAATFNEVMKRLDPELPLNNPAGLSTVVGQSLGQQRLLFTLLALFAGLALTLAAVGIYSVVAYSVATRTSEIGVRMALGATPLNVLRLVITQAMKPVLIGGVIGLAVCIALGHLLQRQLFGVSASDPMILAAVCAGLVLVALIASWVPARRATRVDPMVALRFQ